MINIQSFPQAIVSPFVSPFVSPYVGIGNPTVSPPTHEQPRELSLPRYVNYLADYSG
jgi:hypothetical protein